MWTTIQTDRLNNTWVRRNAHGRFIVVERLPGNTFRRSRQMTRASATALFAQVAS